MGSKDAYAMIARNALSFMCNSEVTDCGGLNENDRVGITSSDSLECRRHRLKQKIGIEGAFLLPCSDIDSLLQLIVSPNCHLYR